MSHKLIKLENVRVWFSDQLKGDIAIFNAKVDSHFDTAAKIIERRDRIVDDAESASGAEILGEIDQTRAEHLNWIIEGISLAAARGVLCGRMLAEKAAKGVAAEKEIQARAKEILLAADAAGIHRCMVDLGKDRQIQDIQNRQSAIGNDHSLPNPEDDHESRHQALGYKKLLSAFIAAGMSDIKFEA